MLDVSQVLSRLDSGDQAAADELLPLVYDELRKLAAAKLSLENPGQTLQATALVHEAFLRLVVTPQDAESNDRSWDGRGHFFAAAAEAMRRILVESARRKRRLKHGGGFTRREIDEVAVVAPEIHEDLLALDEALERFQKVNAKAAELVKLRYFAGLSISEAAELLEVHPRTADRLWAFARAWLHREVEGPGEKLP